MNPFRKLLVQMQVITSALTAGLLVMVIVVVAVVTLMGKGMAAQVKFVAPNVPLVTMVLGIFSLVLFFSAWLAPEVIERVLVRRLAGGLALASDDLTAWEEADPAWVERPDAKGLYQLVRVLHNKTILRAGLLEGLGMLAGMAYLVEAHAASLVFMAVSQLWLIWSIPTRAKVYEWLGRQVERLRYQAGAPTA